VIHRRQPPLVGLDSAPERHHLVIGGRDQIDLLHPAGDGAGQTVRF
jgi:hypothetical protein